ncbi:MAG: flagellin [Acetobacteraceae bacterium]
MSTINGTYAHAGFGQLTRLVADNAAARERFERLNTQASTGRIAETYAGLGSGAATSLSLRPEVASLKTWQANIDATDMRMEVADSAMTAIQGIAGRFLAQLNSLNGLSAQTVDATAENARSALAEVANLLNSQAGGVYVFAGRDTANPPVPDADAITGSGFFTQIAAAVAGLAANGATATAAATLAIGQSNASGTSPFSSYLSQAAANLGTPVVQVGPDQTVATGMLASANVAVPSDGASTTGSYMRDLMRALATIGSLSSAQVDVAGFADLVQDTRISLTGAISTMANETGVIGDRRAALQDIRSRLGQTEIALSDQLDRAENVDMAETLSNLSFVQTQIQASYQLIVGLNGLSLTKYLGS